MRYIALLRGVNVGGHAVRMEHLRSLFGAIGLSDVRSYIQSGNVFFESPSDDRTGLTRQIERHLHDSLGYEVPVFLRTVPEFERVLARDPFRDVVVTPQTRLCVVFTAAPLAPLDLPIRSPKGDMEIIDATSYEAFMTWHIVDGKPPAFDTFLAKTLQTQLTTRFFATAVKILHAAEGP
jgi:uncharacterized protein (DUF1697 family)